MKSFLKFMEMDWNPSKFLGMVSRNFTLSEFFLINHFLLLLLILRDLKDSKGKATGKTQ